MNTKCRRSNGMTQHLTHPHPHRSPSANQSYLRIPPDFLCLKQNVLAHIKTRALGALTPVRIYGDVTSRAEWNLRKYKYEPRCGSRGYCLTGCLIKQSNTSCTSGHMGYVTMIVSKYPDLQTRLYFLLNFCLLMMQAHWALSNIIGKFVSQTKSKFQFQKNQIQDNCHPSP